MPKRYRDGCTVQKGECACCGALINTDTWCQNEFCFCGPCTPISGIRTSCGACEAYAGAWIGTPITCFGCFSKMSTYVNALHVRPDKRAGFLLERSLYPDRQWPSECIQIDTDNCVQCGELTYTCCNLKCCKPPRPMCASCFACESCWCYMTEVEDAIHLYPRQRLRIPWVPPDS